MSANADLIFVEDLFNPFMLCFDFRQCRNASVIASLEQRDTAKVIDYRRSEITRRRAAANSSPVEEDFAENLATAAEQFIVSRGDQKTVIAGYHWFSDWGRDTMIALPGLTLSTGKYDIARSILRAFAKHVDQGMLPNRFPDAGDTPEYNTVDATLWFFEAARELFAYSGDEAIVRTELYPVFADIIVWHVRGTLYESRLIGRFAELRRTGSTVDLDGAKVGDRVVTPRRGKPVVEIQALRYNALCIMEGFAQRQGAEPTLTENVASPFQGERRQKEIKDRGPLRFPAGEIPE